jgi:hypothetical protein
MVCNRLGKFHYDWTDVYGREPPYTLVRSRGWVKAAATVVQLSVTSFGEGEVTYWMLPRLEFG